MYYIVWQCCKNVLLRKYMYKSFPSKRVQSLAYLYHWALAQPPPPAEKIFTFDMLNFAKLVYAPPPTPSKFLDTALSAIAHSYLEN